MTTITPALDQLAATLYEYAEVRAMGYTVHSQKYVLAGMVAAIAAASGASVDTVCDCVAYDTDTLYWTLTGESVSGTEFEVCRDRLLHHAACIASATAC